MSEDECNNTYDTPRTDVAVINLGEDDEIVNASFARRLELELNREQLHSDSYFSQLMGMQVTFSEFENRVLELEKAIEKTIMLNLHLADGNECTLKPLKDVILFDGNQNNDKPT